MKSQSKDPNLAISLAKQLKNQFLLFIHQLSRRCHNMFLSVKQIIEQRNQSILGSIKKMFSNYQFIQSDDLRGIIKKYTGKNINLQFLYQKSSNKQISLSSFVKAIFGHCRTKLLAEIPLNQRHSFKIQNQLTQMKICKLVIRKSQIEQFFNKNKKIFLKKSSKNTNFLWSILDQNSKNYITFENFAQKMRRIGVIIYFEQWNSLVKYFNQQNHQALQKHSFIKAFFQNEIQQLTQYKKQSSQQQCKIKSKLIPKTQLNWFANNYLCQRLQKPFLKYPKRNLSVGKPGYTPSSHHIKLAW